MAADCPQEAACCTWRNHGLLAINKVSSLGVRSVEPSLTKMTSNAARFSSAATISDRSGAMLPASLRTGITTETAGILPELLLMDDVRNVSFKLFSVSAGERMRVCPVLDI